MPLRRSILAIVTVLNIFTTPCIQASELDYPLTRFNDKIHIVYGPFDLPNEQNRGFRNNIVFVRTTAGLVVFDPGGSAAAGELAVRKAKELGNVPIVAVFDSHAHGDHWLGNEGIKRFFPDALIYGHPNLKARIEGPDGRLWLQTINKLTGGSADGHSIVPIDRTINDGDLVQIGDTNFRIYHTGKAHSDNDVMIEIVGQNMLFTGDVVRNGLLGIMDEDASFKGNIATIDFMLGKKFTYYLPGHGRVGGPEMVRRYRTYLDTLHSVVKGLYDQGLADFEMKPKVIKTLAPFMDWAGFDMRIGAHISRVFLEVEAEVF